MKRRKRPDEHTLNDCHHKYSFSKSHNHTKSHFSVLFFSTSHFGGHRPPNKLWQKAKAESNLRFPATRARQALPQNLTSCFSAQPISTALFFFLFSFHSQIGNPILGDFLPTHRLIQSNEGVCWLFPDICFILSHQSRARSLHLATHRDLQNFEQLGVV